MIAPESYRHSGNDALIVAISLPETRNNWGPNWRRKKGGGTQLYFKQPKIAALTKQCMLVQCHGQSTGPNSAIVLILLVDLLLQMLQNFLVVMLLNRLAWRNKLLMNSTLTIKKDQHALNVQPALPCFLHTWREQAFPLRGLLAFSPKAVLSFSCVSDVVFWCLKQNLMHMHCSFTSATRKLQITLTCKAIKPFSDAMQRFMAAKHYMLTYKIAILWQLVAESCTSCCSQS